MTDKIYVDIGYGQGSYCKGYILDISKAGAGIACSCSIPKGEKVDLLPAEGYILPMKAEVVFSDKRSGSPYPFIIGVKFNKLDKEQKNKLEKFIDGLEQRKIKRLSLT
ncbi:MAG: PilZ domain-containing protein [Candidatus Omnitrophota bacterium]|jgi:hypothetical protein|nr:MAG: PilZ domain-containing protein [Candidatus Omnitrophota bacterium]